MSKQDVNPNEVARELKKRKALLKEADKMLKSMDNAIENAEKRR